MAVVQGSAGHPARAALSAGLATWAAGAMVMVWSLLGHPAVEPGDVLPWLTLTALMLVAAVAGARQEQRRTEPGVPPPSASASAWWLLTWFPIFPAVGALQALHAAEVLTDAGRSMAVAAATAAVLLVRGIVLISPAGARLLSSELRSLPLTTAERLAPLAGGLYALTAAAVYPTALTGRSGWAFAALVAGVVTVQLVTRWLARGDRAERRAAADQDARV